MSARVAIKKGRGYAGLEKINLYQYSSEGKYLKCFNSCSELRAVYYSDIAGKFPLMRGKRWELFEYEQLPDGTFYSTYRLGKKNLLRCERIFKSKFCVNTSSSDKEVEVFNLNHEKIGEFKNKYIADLLTGISHNKISHDINRGKGIPKEEIYFKYKTEQ
jgi:hypothetical protein